MIQPNLVLIQVNQISKQLIEWRRQLHQYPELSFQEFGTSRFIAETLRKLKGMKVETGVGVETSVIGTLRNGKGPTIAIRADLDALPITEENQVEYQSKKPGVMHACGHDAHTAILLGAASVLSEEFAKGEINGTVKFVFQPAEESTDEKGLSGSLYLINGGVYDDVNAAISLHMCPWLPVGAAQINDGYSMANVDVFQAKLYGTGGHGAYPELAVDPIWMLGPVMQALYGIVSRRVGALESGVVSIGQIHAGTASNILPSEVSIEGTIRSYTPEVRKLLADQLDKALSIVENLGGRYKLDIQRGEPALKNNPKVNNWLKQAIQELYPDFKLTDGKFGMGGEDFGFVTGRIPGSMFFLGCSLNDGLNRDLHTPIFDLDEDCLRIGTAILTQTAMLALKESGSST